MGDFLIYEQDGAVVTLTMNRPDERNALSGAGQYADFVAACERISRDDSVSVVILTGAGSAFSAGGNVKDMADRKGLSAGSPYQIRNNYRRDIQNIRERTIMPAPEPWQRGPGTMEPLHGYPVRSAYGLFAMPVRTPVRRLLLCSDQVVPGLGREGAFLAAWSAARVVTRSDRRKEWMRRGLWTKIEL